MSKNDAIPETTTDLFQSKLESFGKKDNLAVTALSLAFGLPPAVNEIVAAHEQGDLAIRRAMAAELAKVTPSIANRMWLAAYQVLSQDDESVLADRVAAEASATRSIRDSNRARVTGMQMPGRIVGQDRGQALQAMDTFNEATAVLDEVRRRTGWSLATIQAVYIAMHSLEDGHFEVVQMANKTRFD